MVLSHLVPVLAALRSGGTEVIMGDTSGLMKRLRCEDCGELLHITTREPLCRECRLVRKFKDEIAELRALIAIADTMYAEHAAVEQARSNAVYQAEFGHNGPRLAGPLGSAGRIYVYNRHRLSRAYPDMPDAGTALGQR